MRENTGYQNPSRDRFITCGNDSGQLSGHSGRGSRLSPSRPVGTALRSRWVMIEGANTRLSRLHCSAIPTARLFLKHRSYKLDQALHMSKSLLLGHFSHRRLSKSQQTAAGGFWSHPKLRLWTFLATTSLATRMAAAASSQHQNTTGSDVTLQGRSCPSVNPTADLLILQNLPGGHRGQGPRTMRSDTHWTPPSLVIDSGRLVPLT